MSTCSAFGKVWQAEMETRVTQREQMERTDT